MSKFWGTHGGFWLLLLLLVGLSIGVISFGRDYDMSKREIKTELSTIRLQAELNAKQIPNISKFVILVENLSEACEGRLTSREVVDVAEIIYKECAANKDIGLTPDIVLGLIERESNFNPEAVSSAKAYGLMQIVEDTWLIHDVYDDWDFDPDLATKPEINVRVGIAELVRLRHYWIAQGQDNWIIPLTSYFWGIRNTWSLLNSKKRGLLPSLEYGKGVMDLAVQWREKGV